MTSTATAPLPATMHHVDHGAGGDADCLRIAESALPVLAAHEVLIRVAAAGVNRPDVLQRSGKYPPPPDASPWLGLEVAGEIAAVGDAVTHWHVGDSVCALTPGGGYAQYCKTPAAHCLPIPHGLSTVEAAALPETFFTVWVNLFERANLSAGETLLVHGGSSGIGSTAIQLARVFGVGKIIATCGSAAKADYARALGADVAVDYRSEDFVAAVKDATDGRGADVILDMVGAPYFQRNLAACAPDGRIAQIAFQHGAKAEINLLELMVKRIHWTGSTLRPRSNEAKTTIANALQHKVWPRFRQNPDALRPHIHAKFALSAVADAHRMMEAGAHLGKIVLVL
ncbi:MAG: NAD(P)H-quinone oxidoreductase [Burkholderiales bacterium]|nr:NAD(P)H-quinone oxidoreductase [Burkholderiales bacterium]